MTVEEETACWREAVERVLTRDELLVFRDDVRKYLCSAPPLIAPLGPRERMEKVAARLLALACAHCTLFDHFGVSYQSGKRSLQDKFFLKDNSHLWETVQDTLDGFLKSTLGSDPRAAKALRSSGDDLDRFIDALRVQAIQACHRRMDQTLRKRSKQRTRAFGHAVELDDLASKSDGGIHRDLELDPSNLIDEDRRTGTRLHMFLHKLLLAKPMHWQVAQLAAILDAPGRSGLKLTALIGDAYISGEHHRASLAAFEALELSVGGARVSELLDRLDAQARGRAHDPRRFGHLQQTHVFAVLRDLGLRLPSEDRSARKTMSILQEQLAKAIKDEVPRFIEPRGETHEGK
jgi:hypothetical protein